METDLSRPLMSGPSLEWACMQRFCFELACFGLEAVELGCDRGVKRLELCSHREQDGLTPEDEMVEAALRLRKPSQTQIIVMLRPDPQDNDLTEGRLKRIQDSILKFRDSGVDGFVVGLATPEGQLPESVLKDLMELAPGLQWVFHRLIDQLPIPLSALRQLLSWGFCRVLSSGGQPTAMQGWNTLMEWQAALPQLQILAGGGLRAAQIMEIKRLYSNLELWPLGGVHSSCHQSQKPNQGINAYELEKMLNLCRGNFGVCEGI